MRKRSTEKELLDLGDTYYTQEEFQHCHTLLYQINRLLGIFKSTLKFIKKNPNIQSVTDVGCGGGLFLINLSKYFPKLKCIGTEIAEDAFRLAKRNLSSHHSNVQFVKTNPAKSDLVMAVLVCHHLNDEELISFLQYLYDTANKWVLIHDLERSHIAYCFYKVVSPFFKNRLITHDGLISIQRGFKKREWQELLAKANISHYQLRWRFPFRWELILWKK